MTFKFVKERVDVHLFWPEYRFYEHVNKVGNVAFGLAQRPQNENNEHADRYVSNNLRRGPRNRRIFPLVLDFVKITIISPYYR